MNHPRTRLAGTIAVMLLMGTAIAAPNTLPLVKDGLSEPVKAWSSAVESGDTAALARMNPASTVVFAPDQMVVRGTQNIIVGYSGMFKKYKTRVAISDAHYIESDNLVHSWGLYNLRLEPLAGGEPVLVNGRFSDIATRVNGEWQYIVDHASLPTSK
ncbi:YybH family protein [Chitinimonas sp. PSY-7]|uniref:DUF4440 domain-containing protein n=1 Tax=Chitinimonas sp. PSY-7 TaxID=3459088 RepID=UPI00403FC88D